MPRAVVPSAAIERIVGQRDFEEFLKWLKALEEERIRDLLESTQEVDENRGAARVLRYVQDQVNTRRK